MRFFKNLMCWLNKYVLIVAKNLIVTYHAPGIMPTKCSDAQPLDEHEKQLPLDENQKLGNVMQ